MIIVQERLFEMTLCKERGCPRGSRSPSEILASLGELVKLRGFSLAPLTVNDDSLDLLLLEVLDGVVAAVLAAEVAAAPLGAADAAAAEGKCYGRERRRNFYKHRSQNVGDLERVRADKRSKWG